MPNFLAPGFPYLYILTTIDRDRIKIGRSIDPLDRIAGLVNIYPEIDLSRSIILGVDTLRIETVLHTVFSSRRQPLPERCDGYTEWFTGDFREEVIDLCQRIAQHRGSHYKVISDVGGLLDSYRQQNRLVGLRPLRPTAAELKAQQCDIDQRLRELACEHALQFIEVLSEKEFDGLICYRDQYYLVRTVQRNAEPECWNAVASRMASSWSQRVVRAADVTIRIDGGSCCFRFLKESTFTALSDQHGLEIYRLSQGPDDPSSGTEVWPDAPAFEMLWDHLLHFELLEGFDSDQHIGQ